MQRPLVLVVDGDPGVRRTVSSCLADAGWEGAEAATAAEALDILRTRPVRILVVDPGTPGIAQGDFLDRARRARPCLVPVALAPGGDSGSGAPGDAFDRIPKPVERRRVRATLDRALRHQEVVEEVARLRDRLAERRGYRRIVGRSDPMERLRERAERLATLDSPVLVVGEEGTGKKLVARTVHEMSARHDGPFAVADCTLPESVLEGELFGFDPGGGGRRSSGLLDGARGGACLLEEVTALPQAVQERLARLLEGRGSRLADGGGPLDPDVRLYASSRRDIDAAVRDGLLHADLHRFLAVGVLHVPPLRERRGDVPLLARHFIETICQINDLPPVHLSPEALERLERHRWPGNVRELRDAVEHAVILATDGVIRTRDLPRTLDPEPDVGDGGDDEALASRPFRDAKRRVVDAFERSYLSGLLEDHGGNVTAAAQRAGMLRSALQRLLRKHDLRSVDFRRGRRESPRSEA